MATAVELATAKNDREAQSRGIGTAVELATAKNDREAQSRGRVGLKIVPIMPKICSIIQSVTCCILSVSLT